MVVPMVPLKLNHWQGFVKLVKIALHFLAFPPSPLQINLPVTESFQNEEKNK